MSRWRRLGAFDWLRSRLSLQLTGALLVISTLPLLIYYGVSFEAAEKTILDITSQQSLQTLRNQRDQLLLQLDQIESLAANLSQLEEITNTLSRVNPDQQISTFDSLATQARIGYLLSNYRNLSGLVSIDIMGLDGQDYHVGDTLTKSNERSGQRDLLWERTLRSQTFVTWHGVEDNVQEHSSAKKVLVASKVLYSSGSSWLRAEPVALLLINYSTDYLYDRLRTVTMGPGASLLVLDDQWRLIYHPDRARIGQPVSAEFAALLSGPSGSFSQRIGADDVLLSYEMIPDKHWYVVSIIPKQTLLAPMARLGRFAVAMLLVMVLLILLLIRLFAIRVIAPINQIAECFKDFQLDRITPGWRMARPRSLEPIAVLAQWFNTFLETMERRREADVRLRIAATAFESQEGMFVLDAEARILQANGALLAITGHPVDELVGRHAALFISDRQSADCFADMMRAVERSGSWQGEIWSQRHDGQAFPTRITLAGVANELGVLTHIVGTLTDITERKASEDEIRRLAFYDPLTGLANRRLLLDRLRQAMLDCPRRKQSLALMMLDLDKFKTLNDTLGHDTGDALLRQVALRLLACVREADTVARFGGDEFVVLIEGLGAAGSDAAAQAKAVASKILHAVNQDYDDLTALPYHCTVSIGITVHSNPHCSLEDLIKQADIALYQAKEAGRHMLRFFDPAMQAEVMARAVLEQHLQQGLADDRFQVFLQPKVDRGQRIIGAEALVRWDHPELGIVSPADFIAVAEETGLIVELGHAVLRKVCQLLVDWSSDTERSYFRIAVNVSPREFRQTDFVAKVLAIVDSTGVDPRQLILEITESLFVDDVDDVVDKMTTLRGCGVGFALDDFGTGYSSLAYLKRMPLQELKIDASFVRDLLTDGNDATIVRAMIGLGQELGLEVVAEGVESEAQFDVLLANGCHLFQGYRFSAPVTPQVFRRRFGSAANDAARLDEAC